MLRHESSLVCVSSTSAMTARHLPVSRRVVEIVIDGARASQFLKDRGGTYPTLSRTTTAT